MGVADSVRKLAQPLADSLNLILWDVRFFKEGSDWILLLIIDKAAENGEADAKSAVLNTENGEPEDNADFHGVTLSDCEALSRAIDPLLDEADLIDRSYRLQVSSPGLERKLRTAEHFEAYLGEKIFIRLQRAFEGQREFHGSLAGFDGQSLTLLLPDTREMSFTLQECAWIKADDFY